MKKTFLSIIYFVCVINVQAETSINPLHYAVTTENLEYVEELIKEDPVLINGKNEYGNTPVHQAINEKKNDILKFFLGNNINVNPNLKNNKGETLLIYAIKKENVSAVDLLLKAGASPYTKDKNKRDSFFYARLLKDDFIYNLLIEQDKKEIIDKELNVLSLKIKEFNEEVDKQKKLIRDSKENLITEFKKVEENIVLKINKELEVKLESSKYDTEQIYGNVLEKIISENEKIEKSLLDKESSIISLKSENLSLKKEIAELQLNLETLTEKIKKVDSFSKSNKSSIENIKNKSLLEKMYNRKETFNNESPVSSADLTTVENNINDLEMVSLDTYNVIEDTTEKEIKSSIEETVIQEKFEELVEEKVKENKIIQNVIIENKKIEKEELEIPVVTEEKTQEEKKTVILKEVKSEKEIDLSSQIEIINKKDEREIINEKDIIQKPIENEKIYAKDNYAITKVSEKGFFELMKEEKNIMFVILIFCFVIMAIMLMVIMNLKNRK